MINKVKVWFLKKCYKECRTIIIKAGRVPGRPSSTIYIPTPKYPEIYTNWYEDWTRPERQHLAKHPDGSKNLTKKGKQTPYGIKTYPFVDIQLRPQHAKARQHTEGL